MRMLKIKGRSRISIFNHKTVTILILVILSGCISIQNSDNKFISFFPTDADIFGWRVVKKPDETSSKTLKFINENIEKYKIIKTFYAVYGNVNKRDEKITAYVCMTDSPVVSYSIINNEKTKGFNSLSKTTIFRDQTLIAFKGSYVIVISATSMDDNIYSAFNDFLYFFNEHVDDDSSIPDEIANFSFDEITFYPVNYNIFKSGYFIYKYNRSGDNYDVYFNLSDSAFTAKNEYYERIRAANGYVIWSSEEFESAFVKTEDGFTFISHEGRMLFSIYGIDNLEKGKSIVRELIFKFRKNG